MDWQTFRTREVAERHAATMRGWMTRVERMVGTDGARVWVIACYAPGARTRDDAKFLRRDGYVR